MKNYTEKRILRPSKLRIICIKNEWYTMGDNEEYSRLFDRLHDEDGCPLNMTTEKLAEIATDIMEHSKINGYTITTIMFELSRACYSIFDEVA